MQEIVGVVDRPAVEADLGAGGAPLGVEAHAQGRAELRLEGLVLRIQQVDDRAAPDRELLAVGLADLPGPARFMDACAVQVPAKLEANVPDPQMGMQGKGVEITYWRADWQAVVDGRPDSLKEMYPNASINGYPFEANSLEKGSAAQQEMATRYAPARALGNRRVGTRAVPVEDLLAEGPGTLAPASPSGGVAGSKGKGVKSEYGWSVVITRKLPTGLAPGARTQVAFAIWEGGHQETGARKMRTGWIPLLMKGAQ